MRAFSILTAAVLASIAIGSGIEAATQATVYNLDGHRFSAVFPGRPMSTPQPNDPWILAYHGLVAPPSYVVALTLARTSVVNGQSAQAQALVGGGLRIVLRTASPERPGLPASALVGPFQLAPLSGFRRLVTINEFGHGYWFGTEFAERAPVMWAASATAADYDEVRAFLESFTPIS